MQKLLRFSLLLALLIVPAIAQRDIGSVEVIADNKTLPVRVSATTPELNALALQAFGTHGRYRVVASGFAYDIKFSAVTPTQVRVDVVKTAGGASVVSEVVTGANVRNALLRAADVAVAKTNGLGLRGYFASKMAFVSERTGKKEIYTADILFGGVQQITRDNAITLGPRWSPDGKSILYSMAIAGNTDVYRVPATGGDSVKLTDSPGIDVGGSFSPDGTKIVFESDRSGSQQIYVMNADGTNQKRVSFFGGRAATPEWSPRGDQIAFTHIVGNLRIAVMNPGGGDMRYLTDSWQDEAPTWSPNGRIIQFFRTAKSSGRTSIWQVDLTGRNERRLNTPVDASDPAWGPVLP